MTSSQTFDKLVAWLAPAMESEYKSRYTTANKEAELRKLGKYDRKYYPSRAVQLRAVLRKLICENKERRILSDGYGSAIYVYNDLCFEWIKDGEAFLLELFKRTFKALEIGDYYNDDFPAKSIAGSCIGTIMQSDEYRYIPNRRYIAFTNGVFDLEKKRLKAPNINQKPYFVLDFDYKTADEAYQAGASEYGTFDNPCKLWDRKLGSKDEGILPNKGIRDNFQEWCGSLLLDRSVFKQEYACFLVGSGSNGKSVLANVVASVFGERYFTRFSLYQLFKSQSKEANIAKLRGKIANFVDDLDNADCGGEDFKKLVSGALFEARIPYTKEAIQVAAPPLLCCANEIPPSKDDSWGMHRRRLILQTTIKQFSGEERDPMLTHKLSCTVARQYIFNWIYEGYLRVVRNKGEITLCKDAIDAQMAFMNSNSNLRRWWSDKAYVIVRSPESSDPRWRIAQDLKNEYELFCEKEHSIPQKPYKLSNFLQSLGYVKDVNYKRSSKGMVYCVGKIGVDSTEDGELIYGI